MQPLPTHSPVTNHHEALPARHPPDLLVDDSRRARGANDAKRHRTVGDRCQRRQRLGNGPENAKGKLPLPPGSITEALEAQGFLLLPILPRHIEAVRILACAHADPFDRLLIAQAQDERLTLLTRDAAILGLGLDGVASG